MVKSIALLSGKGGSGKTTLSLSIASLLSGINLKVLLVDCDFATNGATYFYENKLNTSASYLSFFDYLSSQELLEKEFLPISNFLDFVPAALVSSNSKFSDFHYSEDINEKIQNFKSEFCRDYDVVIFDCQAGYTDLLKYLLPNMDETLFVMEADAISSAALRALHLKIGNFLNNRKSYQIFNKATPEEFEIYNKISGGTFFTNIETVLFDWKIRKAFALAEIPDMEKTSAKYGEQIYNICKILFPEDKFQEKLSMFSGILEYYKALDEREILLSTMSKEKASYNKRKITKYKLFTLTTGLCSIFSVCLALIVLIDKKYILFIDSSGASVFIAAIFIILISTIGIFISSVLRTSSDVTRNFNEGDYNQKINAITEKIDSLLQQDNEILLSRLR